MSDATTHLRLPYILAAQAQKHVTHNEALRIIDVSDVLFRLADGVRICLTTDFASKDCGAVLLRAACRYRGNRSLP